MMTTTTHLKASKTMADVLQVVSGCHACQTCEWAARLQWQQHIEGVKDACVRHDDGSFDGNATILVYDDARHTRGCCVKRDTLHWGTDKDSTTTFLDDTAEVECDF